MLPILMLALACAPTRAIEPLPPKTNAINVSVGGPIVDYFGGPKPLPITAIGYTRGLDGRTNFHAGLYPTQLVLFGLFGADVGVARELLTPNRARPRVMADLTVYVFAGDNASGEPAGGVRVFPDLSVVASWPLGDRHAVYGGVDTFVQPFPKFHIYPTPIVGGRIGLSDHVGLQPELKWIAPWQDSEILVPDYPAPGQCV